MSGEVLAHGGERPPGRSWRGPMTGLLALALLGAGLYASRHGYDRPPRAAASPNASESVPPLETQAPPDVSFGEEPPADPFATFVTVPKPKDEVTPVLLPGDTPGFFVVAGRETHAYAAVSGTQYLPRLVGWCAASRTFEDLSGEFRSDENGIGYGGSEGLTQYPVRPNADDPFRVDVGSADSGLVGGNPPGPPRDPPPRACRSSWSLLMPPLPQPVSRFETGPSFRKVHGRYVLTTDHRAFCDSRITGRCEPANATFSETANPLDASDLVGSYTYEGDFAVRVDRFEGTMDVVLLPWVRLVRRDAVGVRARCGRLLAVTGTGRAAKVRIKGLTAASDHPLRPDVAVYASFGALGEHPDVDSLRPLPKNTPESTVCAILDASGRVLRIVVDVVEDIVTP